MYQLVLTIIELKLADFLICHFVFVEMFIIYNQQKNVASETRWLKLFSSSFS